MAQTGQEALFHIDHVIPVATGGETVEDNLALACVSCSLRKGARQTAHDPLTLKPTGLFHPRRMSWADHFIWNGCRVRGLTATGRATVFALKLNRSLILAIRAEEVLRGRHPPPLKE
ncbi:MAG: HNH endonuclease signature motif containing protein [Verrucomicrobiota bacterium]